MLTPLDIHNKEFGHSFRGYNEGEVDEFLDEIVKHYENLYRENAELKDSLERIESKLEQYQKMETTLHNTLIVAQETAEEVKLNARKEADLMLKEAELRGQKAIEEASKDVQRLREEFEQLQKEMNLYRTRLRTLIEGQLTLVNSQMSE